jgi:hypothetical protein
LALFADGPVTPAPATPAPVALAPVTLAPVTLATVRRAEALAARPTGELLQALTLLVAGGYIHPLLPDPAAGHATARALNRAIARASADGLDMPRLVAPAIGSVIPADALETAVIGQLLDGAAADDTALTAHVLEVLRRTGRTLRWEGEVVEDPIESRRRAADLVRAMLGPRATLLRALGVLEQKDSLSP